MRPSLRARSLLSPVVAASIVAVSVTSLGCDAPVVGEDAPSIDVGSTDSGPRDGGGDGGVDGGGIDGGGIDGGGIDGGGIDAGIDGGSIDGGGIDGGGIDAGIDGGPDAFTWTPSVVSVSGIALVEGTGGPGSTTIGMIPLTIFPASPVDASVRIVSTPRTASSPGDYRFESDVVTIPRGATTVSAPVTLVSDGLDELDETFDVMLLDATNATIGLAIATISITDDDVADVTLAYERPAGVDITSAPEGSEAAPGSVRIVVRREASAVDGSVTVRTRSGTGPAGARAGFDFADSNNTFPWPAGPAGTIIVPAFFFGDAIGEANETFTVEIVSAVGLEIGTPSSLPVTILNDDPSTISGCEVLSVIETAAPIRMFFRVTSVAPMPAGVNVGFAYGGTVSRGGAGDVTLVSPTASTGAVPFPAGATELLFTFDVRDDTTAEATETLTLTLLSASGGATIDASCATSTLTLEDDD